MAFLYPDYHTAFIGAFSKGKMVAGRVTHLESVTRDPLTQILHPVFAKPDANGPVLKFQLATQTCIGDQPMVADPYESSQVEVRQSQVPGSGSGLYAKKDIAKGSIAAFYNGVRLPYRVGGPKDVWETSAYKIYINADYKSGERMDIPPEYVSLDNYCATLGHKINHSFRPNCEEWFFDHPRFGILPCERAKRDIKAGEELFLGELQKYVNCRKKYLNHFRTIFRLRVRSL